jgi:hypothetical protein
MTSTFVMIHLSSIWIISALETWPPKLLSIKPVFLDLFLAAEYFWDHEFYRVKDPRSQCLGNFEAVLCSSKSGQFMPIVSLSMSRE